MKLDRETTDVRTHNYKPTDVIMNEIYINDTPILLFSKKPE